MYALLLGASEFPSCTELSNPAFGRSKARVKAYVARVLGVTVDQTLDLFDSSANATDQIVQIDQYLALIPADSDLLVYYVGHGGFTGDQEFFLALKGIKPELEDATGLRFASLAKSLRRRKLRIYIILDCCFGGEAVKQLMSPVGDVLDASARRTLPPKGIALLAAASKDRAAKAPAKLELTMFSDALLRILEGEDAGLRAAVSLRTLRDLVCQSIESRFADDGVRPEIHSPFQPAGDVADLPVFPVGSPPSMISGSVHRSPQRFNSRPLATVVALGVMLGGVGIAYVLTRGTFKPEDPSLKPAAMEKRPDGPSSGISVRPLEKVATDSSSFVSGSQSSATDARGEPTSSSKVANTKAPGKPPPLTRPPTFKPPLPANGSNCIGGVCIE